MTYLIWTILIIFFLYAFQWFLSFFPYLIGLMMKFLFYPVELISQVIYPVWWFVYTVYLWLITWIVFLLITDYFKHKW